MLQNSLFTKIFVKHTDKNGNTSVENIISHQTNRIEEAGSRDAWNKWKTEMQ